MDLVVTRPYSPLLPVTFLHVKGDKIGNDQNFLNTLIEFLGFVQILFLETKYMKRILWPSPE